MNEGAVGLFLFVVVAMVFAIVSHQRLPRNLWKACSLSATWAAAFVVALEFFEAIRGRPDKFILLALPFGWFWGFTIAYVVGKAMHGLGIIPPDHPSARDGG
jgi:hypothetical protein